MQHEPDGSVRSRGAHDAAGVGAAAGSATVSGAGQFAAGSIADSAGTSGVSYMDWWKCYQLLPTV